MATLVAHESSPVEIFGAVTEEACRVLASEAVGLIRFDPDETATLLAQSDTPWDPPPLGTRFTLDGENVVTLVFRTGQTVYKRLAGTGLGFNNNWAPVTLGPDGTAYVGALGGLVMLRDR